MVLLQSVAAVVGRREQHGIIGNGLPRRCEGDPKRNPGTWTTTGTFSSRAQLYSVSLFKGEGI